MKATILDGKKVAEGMLDEVKQYVVGKNLKLAVVQVGENAVSESYIAEKQRIGQEIGVGVEVFRFLGSIEQQELVQAIQAITGRADITGIIVQLPLPKAIQREVVLNKILLEKDVDVLSEQALKEFEQGEFPVVPPTVGAIQALFSTYSIGIQGKKVVLVGLGRLVGLPISLWLKQEDVEFEIATKETVNLAELAKTADIIISGVGKPNLITGDMVKEGVVVVDAGTSVEDGKTTGDVDFVSVSRKASYITPVPGGVGPLTVACLFRNLVNIGKINT
jgi:methylenetetrahydrofolate dehydrogenase (NADP+) / methenyltetrahydrofolate cyclohydrolase